MSRIIQAQFRSLLSNEKSNVELITNKDLPVSYSLKTKGISKYKKVSTDKKQLLIQLIARQGQSIIESAKSLGINYSTAKSIIINHKKRKLNDSEMDTLSSHGIDKQAMPNEEPMRTTVESV